MQRGRSDSGTEDGTPEREIGYGRGRRAVAGRPGGNSQPLVEDVQAYGVPYGEREKMDGRGQGDCYPFNYL